MTMPARRRGPASLFPIRIGHSLRGLFHRTRLRERSSSHATVGRYGLVLREVAMAIRICRALRFLLSRTMHVFVPLCAMSVFLLYAPARGQTAERGVSASPLSEPGDTQLLARDAQAPTYDLHSAFIRGGKIDTIGPAPILPGQIVVIQAQLLLARPAEAREIQRSVRVAIDGVFAESANPNLPGAATSFGAERFRPQGTSSDTNIPVLSTFVVKVPELKSDSKKVSIVLFSEADGGWIPGTTNMID